MPSTLEAPPQPISRPEPESESTPNPEVNIKKEGEAKVFNKEIITQNDTESIQESLNKLYKDTENPEQSLFTLAKELAHLKTNKIAIDKNAQEKVFAKLNKNAAGIFEKLGTAKGAHYLTFLKSINALPVEENKKANVDNTHAKSIQEEIRRLTENNEGNKLSFLCVQAKNLGIEFDMDAATPAIQQEFSNTNTDGQMKRMARAKFLGIETNTPELAATIVDINDKAESRLAEHKETGQLEKYAQLRYAYSYAKQEEVNIPPQDRQALLSHADTLKEQGKKKGSFTQFAQYARDIMRLSNLAKAFESKGNKNAEAFIDNLNRRDNESEVDPESEEFKQFIGKLNEEQAPATEPAQEDPADPANEFLGTLSQEKGQYENYDEEAKRVYKEMTKEARETMTVEEKAKQIVAAEKAKNPEGKGIPVTYQALKEEEKSKKSWWQFWKR